jgi:hypothetical protein
VVRSNEVATSRKLHTGSGVTAARSLQDAGWCHNAEYFADAIGALPIQSLVTQDAGAKVPVPDSHLSVARFSSTTRLWMGYSLGYGTRSGAA